MYSCAIHSYLLKPITTQTGTHDLLQVMVHEFGHSLGIRHSTAPGSAMAAYYSGYNSGFKLAPDDIAAIRMIYGKIHNTYLS